MPKQDWKQKIKDPLITNMFQDLQKSMDFIVSYQETSEYIVGYYQSLVRAETIHRDILPYMKESQNKSVIQILSEIPITDTATSIDVTEIKQKLLQGYVYLYFPTYNQGLIIPAEEIIKRNITPT